MTKIIIKKAKDGEMAGFVCEGHAAFGQRGADIVCAALSVLTINTVNSLDILLKEPMEVMTDDEAGIISLKFLQKPSGQARLLMESYCLGISEVFNHYGKKYVQLEFEDV